MEKRSAIQHVFKALFHLASVVSLMLFLLTVVGWAWSNEEELWIGRGDGTFDEEIHLSASLGVMCFDRQTGLAGGMVFPPGLFPPSPPRYAWEVNQRPKRLEQTFLEGYKPSFDHLGVVGWISSVQAGESRPVWGIQLPCWYAGMLFALLPFYWYLSFRRRPNAKPGHGFDVEITKRPGQSDHASGL